MYYRRYFNKFILDAIDSAILLEEKLANGFVIRLANDAPNFGMVNEEVRR
jgi:hypothetical protein